MHNLIAHWPAPPQIRALSTSRMGGSSLAPYHENNLALHVGDNHEHVLANREQLVHDLNLPKQPEWLNQTHSTHCIHVEQDPVREGDAAITRDKSRVLAIMTADCLPILLCNRQGTEIAAIHAGWRGLLNGVIDNTLNKMISPRSDIMAWIGPGICQNCYEVGEEVLRAFIAHSPDAQKRFKPSSNNTTSKAKWLANLPLLAEDRLNMLDISAVYQSKACTFEQDQTFYSYRRSAQTGRIATLIWFTQSSGLQS